MTEKFKIFLSHIHEERGIAIALKQELERLYLGAIDIFVSSDKDGIRGGDRWLQIIEEKLIGSDLIFVLSSPNSIKRPWINFEAGGGWCLKKIVIPLCVLGLTPTTLPEPLHSLQGYNIEDKSDLNRILVDISKYAKLRVPETDLDVLYNKIKQSLPQKEAKKETEWAEEENCIEPESTLPTLYQASTVIFSERAAAAFPGARGLRWFTDPKEGLERLLILLRQPLVFKLPDGGYNAPIWWWRGMSSTQIESFQQLGQTKCLMNINELEIDKVAVYRSNMYYRDLVYVETKPEPPIGIYTYENGQVSNEIQHFGYSCEEYGLYEDTPISRAEYDDGAAVIHGKVVDTKGDAKLRVRYLSKYNFFIAPHSSPINSTSFERISEAYLNDALMGKNKIDELIEKTEKLPRNRD